MSKFPYQVMFERKDLLERLDLRVHWGQYEIRVLRFHLTSFEPGKVIPFHQHAEYEFHYIPRGKGKVILIDQTFEIQEGSMYLTGPGLVHYQEADSKQAMDELCLHIEIIKRDTLTNPISAYADPLEIAEAQACIEKLRELPAMPTEDRYDAMPCFLQSYKACLAQYPGQYTTIKHFIIQILLRTVRAYDDEIIPLPLPARDMKDYRYQYAMQYIEANYMHSLTLQDVADKLHMSARQLQRILHEKHQGRSFREIVEDVRLLAVTQGLKTTTASIDEIAKSAGYANANYLHHVFRKRFGVTPAVYRQAHEF